MMHHNTISNRHSHSIPLVVTALAAAICAFIFRQNRRKKEKISLRMEESLRCLPIPDWKNTQPLYITLSGKNTVNVTVPDGSGSPGCCLIVHAYTFHSRNGHWKLAH